MNYSIKDVAVIIATYNRSVDLVRAISSFKKDINQLNEIIIIDQSTDESTKNAIKDFKSNKIKYYHSNIPSLTAARNTGISKISNKSKIAIFIDDDVTLDKKYFNGILDVFNKYQNAKGVSGYFLPNIKFSIFDRAIRRLFLIEHYSPNSARVFSAYGAVYPSELNKVINSEWIPGFNMAYKTEVFTNEKFDSNLIKYALAEDFDFSTRMNKRYPKSLYITPYAKIIHHVSTVERTPTAKLAYMNQINHTYIHFKNFESFLNDVKLFWVLLGTMFLRTLQLIRTRTKTDRMKLLFFVKSLSYTYSNLHNIRKGKLKVVYEPLFN